MPFRSCVKMDMAIGGIQLLPGKTSSEYQEKRGREQDLCPVENHNCFLLQYFHCHFLACTKWGPGTPCLFPCQNSEWPESTAAARWVHCTETGKALPPPAPFPASTRQRKAWVTLHRLLVWLWLAKIFFYVIKFLKEMYNGLHFPE